MPNAIVLLLQRMNERRLPAAVGECTHGAFFYLLKQADPALADHLHDNPERKPFTLSAVQEEECEQAHTGGSAGLRITFLDDDLWPPFAGALLHGCVKAGVRIGEAEYGLSGLLTAAGHPLVGPATYAELWEQARPAELIAVRFDAPTLFKSQGKDVFQPTPRYVWQSWVRTWNAHCGPKRLLDETRVVELAENRVTVEDTELETCSVVLAGGRIEGFVGTWLYGLQALSTEDQRTFALLADFAFYAGTGRKTAMGLGQTVRLMPSEFEEE